MSDSSSSLLNPFAQASTRFKPKVDYDTDPTAWGREKLDDYYHHDQRLILESVRDNRYTAAKSCHGAGKSFIAARIAAKWLDLHTPGEAFVVSTAPTGAQVSAILWREIARAHRLASLPGKITTSGYPKWMIDNELVGYGRKPSDYDEAAFQGIHARHVLVILDEAGGIDKNLFDAVDALATNENARVLAIGNPDNPSSHFFDICRPDSGWNVIRIDGLRTPNFTREAVTTLNCPQCRVAGASRTLLQTLMEHDEIPYNTEEVPDDLRPLLLTPLWVEERLHRWVGRATSAEALSRNAAESSLFTSKVRGDFPSSDTEGVIPLGWVEAAMQRWRDWQDADRPAPGGAALLGVDVAREGSDETCLAMRIGNVTTWIRKYSKADTMQTTGYVKAAALKVDALPIVDVIGVGGGVVDRLREQDIAVVAFNAAKSAGDATDTTGEFKFKNLRAAAWWNLRSLLDPAKKSQIALPDSEMLKSDLTAPRWTVTSGGRIQVEAKDDIKKRLGRSTDEGDAVVMAHWLDAGVGLASSDDGVVSWWDDGQVPDADVYSWNVPMEGLAGW